MEPKFVVNLTSFTLLNEKATAMSPKGNHALAIINGTEDYDLPITSLSDLVEEVKHLSSIIKSRLTIVSCEAKKKQQPLSELFTWTTTKKLGNAQAKPP